jgi:hypothetical protein
VQLNFTSACPFLVVRFREASPPRDHTDRNSVTEAATNWEFVLVAMLGSHCSQDDSVSIISPVVFTGQGHIREVAGGFRSSEEKRPKHY